MQMVYYVIMEEYQKKALKDAINRYDDIWTLENRIKLRERLNQIALEYHSKKSNLSLYKMRARQLSRELREFIFIESHTSNKNSVPLPQDKKFILADWNFFIEIKYTKHLPKGISITIPISLNPMYGIKLVVAKCYDATRFIRNLF